METFGGSGGVAEHGYGEGLETGGCDVVCCEPLSVDVLGEELHMRGSVCGVGLVYWPVSCDSEDRRMTVGARIFGDAILAGENEFFLVDEEATSERAFDTTLS